MFKTFSLAVIAGFEKLRKNGSSLQSKAAIKPARFSKIAAGSLEFSDAELDRIEQLSGKTAGQLAASVSEPHGGRLTDLVNALAEFDNSLTAIPAGSFAAAASESGGGPMPELCQLWAQVDKTAKAAMTPHKKPAKRATKPRRAATQHHLV